jgi:hypothetical protein
MQGLRQRNDALHRLPFGDGVVMATDLSGLSPEQLTALQEKLQGQAAEHRRSGISRTKEEAHRRVDDDLASSWRALAELVQAGRHAAINGTLTLATRWGVSDLLAARQWADLLHAAVDQPAAPGNAETLADYSADEWRSKSAQLEQALDEVEAEVERREAQEWWSWSRADSDALEEVVAVMLEELPPAAWAIGLGGGNVAQVRRLPVKYEIALPNGELRVLSVED